MQNNTEQTKGGRGRPRKENVKSNTEKESVEIVTGQVDVEQNGGEKHGADKYTPQELALMFGRKPDNRFPSSSETGMLKWLSKASIVEKQNLAMSLNAGSRGTQSELDEKILDAFKYDQRKVSSKVTMRDSEWDETRGEKNRRLKEILSRK